MLVAQPGWCAGPDATGSSEIKVPVEIQGKKVEYMGKEGRAVFSGGVTVVRGTSILKCETLETLHGSVEARARGDVFFQDKERKIDLRCARARYTHGLRHVKAEEDCQLILGEGEALTIVVADYMELHVESREASARGNVRIVQGDSEAKCSAADLFSAEDRIVLSGGATIKRPPHEFWCEEAESFFREGRTLLKGSVRGTMHAEGVKDFR